MPFIDRSDLNYRIGSTDSFRRWEDTRAPTAADYKQFKTGDHWLNTIGQDWWICCHKDATSALWRKLAGTSAAAETFIPDGGTSPVVPDASNQITFTGGNGIVTTGGLNTMDWAMQSPFVGDFNFENNTAATALELNIVNNDTDPASSSALNIDAQVGGGDSFIHFDVIGGTYDYSFGIDNSDGDRFKFNTGANPSAATDIFMVDTALDSFWHYNGQIFQSNDWAGGTVFTRIQNTDNTNVGSNACLEILPGGAGGGDPYVQWQVGAVVQQYSLGIDNSVAGDPLKLTDGASPSAGNELITVDGAANGNFVLTPRGSGQVIVSTGTPVAQAGANRHRLSVVESISAGVVTLEINNTENTNAASHAQLNVYTAGDNGGDPSIFYNVIGTTGWNTGIDNSDADSFKVSTGINANPSTGTLVIKATTAGEVTMPLQPAFFAYLAGGDANVTGNATDYTIGTGTAFTEIFDQNADFNTNGTFTSPVDGRYNLTYGIQIEALAAANTFGFMSITTSNQLITSNVMNWGAVRTGMTVVNAAAYSMGALANMDAADTAIVKIRIDGGAAVVDIVGAADANTYFCGKLEC